MVSIKVIGTQLHQWESGRQVQIFPLRGMKVCAVHFSHLGDAEALVVEPREENNMIVAGIPNVLLQSASNLVVYSVNVSDDCVETLTECVLSVRPRPKPSDYVYTETEVLTYLTLSKRIDRIEEEGIPEEQIAIAVEKYLDENPATGTPGKDGEDGEDGYSPTATVTQTETGATVSITDKDGTTTAIITNGKDGRDGQDGHTPVKGIDYFDGVDGKDGKDGYTPQKGVDYFDGQPGKDGSDGKDGADGYTPVKGKDYFDGKDGQDGSDGKDGVSPTVSVSAITGGHRITITDKNGTKTVDVMDGSDGEDGSNGKNGNGIKSAVLNADYTLTLTFDDGTSYTTPSIRGATGATGSAGKDGTSVTHSWSGTTLIVTSASGTTSANLKGDKGDKGDTGGTGAAGTSVTVKSVSESTADGGSNVVTFSDGKTLNVKNGSKGNKGDPYTLTNADKATIVNAVIAALPVYNGEVL